MCWDKSIAHKLAEHFSLVLDREENITLVHSKAQDVRDVIGESSGVSVISIGTKLSCVVFYEEDTYLENDETNLDIMCWDGRKEGIALAEFKAGQVKINMDIRVLSYLSDKELFSMAIEELNKLGIK